MHAKQSLITSIFHCIYLLILDGRDSRNNNNGRRGGEKDSRPNGGALSKEKKLGTSDYHHHAHSESAGKNRSNRSHQLKTFVQQGPRSPN